jgi:hypothetical protein
LQNIHPNSNRHVIFVHIPAKNHSFAPFHLARNDSLAQMSSHAIQGYTVTTTFYKLGILVAEVFGKVVTKGSVVVNLSLSLVQQKAETMMMRIMLQERREV